MDKLNIGLSTNDYLIKLYIYNSMNVSQSPIHTQPQYELNICELTFENKIKYVSFIQFILVITCDPLLVRSS